MDGNEEELKKNIDDVEDGEELKKNIDDVEDGEELKKEMLKPIVKSKSETDKELQDFEVETTAGGIGGSGG
jgi:plasmid rolling circle replication initiator protein Rep